MFQHPCEDYFSCPRDEYLDALYKTILDLQGIPRPRSELLYNGHRLQPAFHRLHMNLPGHFRKHKKTHVLYSLASAPGYWVRQVHRPEHQNNSPWWSCSHTRGNECEQQSCILPRPIKVLIPTRRSIGMNFIPDPGLRIGHGT